MTRTLMYAVGVLAALLVVTSCASSGEGAASITGEGSSPRLVISPEADQQGPFLTFLGDSITVLSAKQLVDRFGGNYRVAVDAENGIRTDGLAPRVAAAAAHKPDIAVINIGTNDAACDATCHVTGDRASFDAAAIDGRLDALDEAFPKETCVVFVNVSTHNPGWGPVHARMINAHMAQFANVVDWDGAWEADWFDAPDDPHPNPRGRAALADLIAAEVATCTAVPS